uniref:YqaJ viral recombinase domain-containing protein n=1 Tax=Sparus aurata TaxID=8175 RepID=A0A671THN6_SPAAU
IQTLPVKIFDGLVTSPGFAQAEDKALYVLPSLAVTWQEKEQIEGATVGQAKNALWSAYRKKRITASNFGLVLAAVKRKSYLPSLFKTLLGQYNLKEGSKVCDWGILHEPRAKKEYTERTGAIIQERGVFLSDSGLLGGSPDGTVSDDCIIEVKCPWSARTKTVLQAAESRDFFLVLDEVTGSLSLKQNHNYWHQIQGNLHLTRANSCHLLVWTPLDLVILQVLKDPTWAANIDTLETFYKDCFLPHILLHL